MTTETFAAYAERWLTQVRHRVRPQTLDGYRQIVRAHWGPRLGAVPLDAIRRPMIRAGLRSLLASGRAPGSVRNDLRVLGVCLQDAVEDERIPTNPARGAGRGVLPRGTGTLGQRPLSEPELTAILLAARRVDADTYDLVALLALTGLRIGELLALRWDRLDLADRRATIATTKVRGGNVGPTKSGTVADIDLPLVAVDVLAGRHDRHPGTTHIFELHPGRAASYTWAFHRWHRVLEIAGLPDRATLHVLRHTYATRLIAVAPIEYVQRQMRHGTIRLAADLYARYREHRCLAALEKFAAPVRRLRRRA